MNDVISFVLLQTELRSKVRVFLIRYTALGAANKPIFVLVHFDQTVD